MNRIEALSLLIQVVRKTTMMTIYVDPFTRTVAFGESLPKGWVVPAFDISPRDYPHHEPLPHGVVVAFSSRESEAAQLRRKRDEVYAARRSCAPRRVRVYNQG